MTDLELEELKNRKNELNNSIKQQRNQVESIYTELYYINKSIEEEEKSRNTEKNFNFYLNNVKNFLNNYIENKKVRNEIWIVEINGKRYTSNKSKSTWTSYAKALDAIYQFIYYNISSDNNFNLSEIIDKLIEEKYIIIKQIL